MLERIPSLPGKRLDAQEYLDDFWARFQGHSGDFWKLERCQHFIEPGVPSWEAFAAGEWERALALAVGQRPAVREYIAANRHLNRRRVRIVEHPLTPYLHWELHVLRIRVEEGDNIRVLRADAVREYEQQGRDGEPAQVLPELIVLGSVVLYEVCYDASGKLDGARRIDDAAATARCEAELQAMYGSAQDFSEYFEAEVAPLPPPTVQI
jgi:hypothetical protein